ncbi:MAG: hypothetical protein AUI14_22050 [Actinobacteria bacterium 13_2_20CM_2_71_6]|nr:MAG: hypothetical protein AUI14_22050 [Actinobacteria bacterium 13_2_20CM_2_71_6]
MSNQSAIRPRTELPFRREEWDLLVKLPGRVVVAATSAEADRARRTVAEGLAGIDAIAAGRASASRLVRDVVAAIYDESDDDQPAAEEFRHREAGIAEVLASCRVAGRLLVERAGRVEADAYRNWLGAIATRVCHAARTGGVLGLGGQAVSPAERRFLADLAAAFDG